MKASRGTVFEAQLKTATEMFERRKKALTDKKLDKKTQKKDPQFRALFAKVQQFKTRIAALKKLDDREIDLAKRREERAIKAKEPKVKKKKVVEAAPKKKAEKKAKKEGGEAKA